jgi:hypothetical protein
MKAYPLFDRDSTTFMTPFYHERRSPVAARH